MYNLDNPDNCNKVEDKIINKEDARIVEVKSNIGINQRQDKIAELIWVSYCRVIRRPL